MSTETEHQNAIVEEGPAAPDVPELDEGSDSETENTADSRSNNMSRAEKKVRKALEKLSLKHIQDASRVVLRADRTSYVIDAPDVYKSNTAEVYVVFGEAKPEDQLSQLQSLAQQSLGSAGAQEAAAAAAASLAGASGAQDEDDGEEVDAGDLPEEDIEMVMSNTSVSRNKAIKALKAANGVVVDAIIAVSD